MGNADTAAIVAFVALSVGLWLVADSSTDPERAAHAAWHRPMGWVLVASAIALVILGVSTAAGSPPARSQAPDPASSTSPSPTPFSPD